MRPIVSNVAFSSAVKSEQERRGSRAAYEKMEKTAGWESQVTPYLEAALAHTTSFYLGTANAEGQPYIQHRGGPAGFLRVLDKHTLGFVDFAGNRQYITIGNLSENPQAHIFVMDYTRRQRIKVWGTARVIEDDDELLRRLQPTSANSMGERVILFEIKAWDRNCPQHIPQRIDQQDVAAQLAEREERICSLERELKLLNSKLCSSGQS